MTAKELLTIIQQTGKNIHSNAEFLKNIEKNNFFDKEFINNYIKTTNEQMPTDFQNSHFYDIIKNSFVTLKDTITNASLRFKGEDISPCDVPLFGTADFKEFDAFVETSDDESVIVFNEGLIMFIQRLKEIYTIEHWLKANNKITKQMDNLLTLNFFDIMLSFHLFSNAYYAIPLIWCNAEDLNDIGYPEKICKLESPFDKYIGNQNYMDFEFEISLSTYLWIAAHEYSHIVLGHLKDNNDISKLHLNGIEVNKIDLNQKQELDADLLGAIISLESESSHFIANGIYLVLTCLMLSYIDTNENYNIDHPPVKDRINNIFNNIETDTKYFISNYKNVAAIFSKKYQNFKELLYKIDKDNISFSSIHEMQYYIYKVYHIED